MYIMDSPESTVLYEMDTNVMIKNVEDSASFIDEPLWVTIIVRIMILIWIGCCIIPNSIIIRRIGNSELYKTKNFYFILVHLSWGNLLQMIYTAYSAFVTEEYQADSKIFVFLLFHVATTQTHIQHALFFSLDKYVNSKKFCRSNIKNNWTLHAFGILLMTILIMHDLASIYAVFNGLIIISSIICFVYILRFYLYLIKGSDQEHYSIRLAISGFCLATNYGYVVCAILANFYDNNSSTLFNCISFIVHTSGGFTLLLLNYNDPNVDVKLRFRESCRKFILKFRKCFARGTDVTPLEVDKHESSMDRDITLRINRDSSAVGNVPSSTSIPELTHQHGWALDMFETISVGNKVACVCNDCTFGRQHHHPIQGVRKNVI